MGARCISALGHGQVRECGMHLLHWTQGSVLEHASWCEVCTCGCAIYGFIQPGWTVD